MFAEFIESLARLATGRIFSFQPLGEHSTGHISPFDERLRDLQRGNGQMFAFPSVTAIFTASGVRHLIRRLSEPFNPGGPPFAARARSVRVRLLPTAVIQNKVCDAGEEWFFRRGGDHVPVRTRIA